MWRYSELEVVKWLRSGGVKNELIRASTREHRPNSIETMSQIWMAAEPVMTRYRRWSHRWRDSSMISSSTTTDSTKLCWHSIWWRRQHQRSWWLTWQKNKNPAKANAEPVKNTLGESSVKERQRLKSTSKISSWPQYLLDQKKHQAWPVMRTGRRRPTVFKRFHSMWAEATAEYKWEPIITTSVDRSGFTFTSAKKLMPSVVFRR